MAGPYDAVIIAAPLEQSKIEFDGIDVAMRPKRTYQETVTTYVTGTLRPGYFGVSTLPTGKCSTDMSSLYARPDESTPAGLCQRRILCCSRQIRLHSQFRIGLQSCTVVLMRVEQLDVTSTPHGPRRYSSSGAVGALRCRLYIRADLVLVTETADTPFSVISPLQRLPDGQTLYKLFSRRSVRHLLPNMFAHLAVVAEHKWAAYPRFAPPEQFAPFTLAPGIFYNNAWENAGDP